MQPAKALDPILSSVLGKFTFFRLLFSSNELSKMKHDGLIDYQKNDFILINNDF